MKVKQYEQTWVKRIKKNVIYTRNSKIYNVASWACEVIEILTQRITEFETFLCEDYSDLTSPASNHIPDIDIAVSVVYGTLKKKSFSRICVHIV